MKLERDYDKHTNWYECARACRAWGHVVVRGRMRVMARARCSRVRPNECVGGSWCDLSLISRLLSWSTVDGSDDNRATTTPKPGSAQPSRKRLYAAYNSMRKQTKGREGEMGGREGGRDGREGAPT